MAYCVSKSILSYESMKTIERMLEFTPVGNKYQKMLKQPKPIKFFLTQEDKVYLPYMFASSLLQIIPNMDISHTKCTFNFNGKLREDQVIVEQEAWEQLQKYGTCTLALYPGFGKTILGVKLASRLNLLTAVLVHREILTVQWKRSLEEFSNAKVWVVKDTIVKDYNVIICMDTRWHLIPKEIRESVGFLIIDEAHAFCTSSHVACLLSFQPKFILVESATLERDDNMHQMIYSIVGYHGVYRNNNKPFSVTRLDTNIKPIRKENYMGIIDWSKLLHSVLFNNVRNKIILDLITSNIEEHNILILTSLVEHAKILYESIKNIGISCDYMYRNKKTYEPCKVLIGTISKIGTGFDQETFCNSKESKKFSLLILASSIKKYSTLVQSVGRVFRVEYPKIIFLVDDDWIFRNHWEKAKKWFLLRGGKIIENDSRT